MVSAVTNTAVLPATTSGAAHPTAPYTGGRASVRTLVALGRKLDAQDPQVAQEAGAQMASELFFAPLLAEMRRFPFGRDLATGGQTESTFGQQLDQRIADSVARSDQGLVRQIVRYMDKPARGQAATTAEAELQAGTSARGAL